MGRDAGSGGRFTSRSTWALIGALFALVVALALCLDRFHNGDFYLSLVSGRFVAQHGFVEHYPFATIAKGGTWLNQQWLSELAFFRVAQVLGPSGLAILYAFLITAPLALLLWLCRRKGWSMLVAVAAFYFPGLLAVVHPRAAGFTVVIFSLLVALLAIVWRGRSISGPGRRPRWWVGLAIVALFALWANLHCGFIAGLLLLGLVTVGFAIDHWRGIPWDAAPVQDRRARADLCPRRPHRHGRDPAGGRDLVVPAELPEPGDLAGQHRVALRRLKAGAVIAHVPSAIQAIQAAGFTPVYSTPQGTYLVRPQKRR